jgi:hypothetical protein
LPKENEELVDLLDNRNHMLREAKKLRKELKASLEDARNRVAELETKNLEAKLEIDSFRCTRLVFWSFLFYPNNTVKNLIFRQRFPILIPLLQWRLPGLLLLLQRLMYMLHLLLRWRLPALLLLLLERLLFRLLLILMLQLLLRQSFPRLL